MKRSPLFVILAAGIYLSACQSPTTKTTEKTDTIITAQHVVIGDAVTNRLYANYILLKDALVKADTATAASAGASVAADLQQIAGCEEAAKVASGIATAATIEAQRKGFVILNGEVIPVIKHAGLTRGNIFVQYCPMANDSKGAYWLASEKEIRNPYYGDEMLTCGEVKEVVK
ncbi:DUF3347 domain-containing protein [Hufsiella ginkgonis]|uniref:DUF3347 domain-containing protein n=1 Tax=Hufsiella ginkgonis TaxID=2695274 RepID=A0A7K1XXZ8_9SPHI|nr:DUF3347 domain-containing protein [Hufsiella ginkgonis]MXV15406.1 DUF3347 domain-containing protein [Hufsiella ginkgonis]